MASPEPAAKALHESVGKTGLISKYLSMIGTAVALLAIVFSSVELHRIRSETAAARAELETTKAQAQAEQSKLQESHLKLVAAQRDLEQVAGQLAFAQSSFAQIRGKLPEEVIKAAIQSAATADPRSAQLTPVIYIHVAREDQRLKAKQIQQALAFAGYQVPGIEYVGAKSPNQSQLRYFIRTDYGPALEKILSQLRSMGLDVNDQFIKMASGKPQALRPNQFELWIGQSYAP